MDYFKHYNKLIERSKNREIDGYVESHHIIPRCLGGSDESDNLVNLTPEEHYVAHQLLIKMYPGETKLVYAATMMIPNRHSNKIYGWLRRRLSENMRKNNPNKNGKSNRKRKGTYKLSEEAKRNIGNASKGRNVGEKNGLYNVKPWNHPRSTQHTREMWKRADEYYKWWISSGLENGQNPMARAFKEKFVMTHTNMIKYFKNGWVPMEDEEWVKFNEST